MIRFASLLLWWQLLLGNQQKTQNLIIDCKSGVVGWKLRQGFHAKYWFEKIHFSARKTVASRLIDTESCRMVWFRKRLKATRNLCRSLVEYCTNISCSNFECYSVKNYEVTRFKYQCDREIANHVYVNIGVKRLRVHGVWAQREIKQSVENTLACQLYFTKLATQNQTDKRKQNKTIAGIGIQGLTVQFVF